MPRNIPFFIAFRVLFNARFYYPVLGVLFLDLGLSVAEYALLNAVWAAAILSLEIPSGALADAIGRKRMVVLAALLMVLELAVFAAVPVGGGAWVFWLLVLNRILSGAAEACASGADEALAYDSLPEANRETTWPDVLSSLVKWQSGAFFFAMLVGAALFDRDFVVAAFSFIGCDSLVGSTTKWPVFATCLTSLLCLAVALAMRDPGGTTKGKSPREAVMNILRGARHVFGDSRVFSLLLALVVCDGFARLLITFASNYNRLLGIPEVLYGPIGAGMALLGFISAPLAKQLVLRSNAAISFSLLAILVVTGLAGAALMIPGAGVLFLIPIGMAMSMGGFFASHYLNSWAGSDIRATVLSFRGVAMNAAYGLFGLGFAVLTARLRQSHPSASEENIFAQSLPWLASSFLIICLAALATMGVHRKIRSTKE
ncbi:MAG: MFS transporter [Terrimicrobiaceae bacterium]